MKIVLEDTRLVALQRDGGAILARMRKEEPRYVHSEDNRCVFSLNLNLSRLKIGIEEGITKPSQCLDTC